MSLQSSKQDSPQEEEKANEGTASFFTPLNPCGDNPDEEPCGDFSMPRKVQTRHSTRICRTHTRDFFSAQDLSPRVRFHVSLKETFHLHTRHSISHVPLLYPSQMSTTSLSTLSTCTPIRPSARPSTRPLLTSSLHGDYTCASSSNVSFGLMAEMQSPTGYEPIRSQ